MIRVLAVDDHPLVLDGVRAMLSGEPEIEIVGTATGGDDGLRIAREEQPDLILLDVSLGRENGLDLLEDFGKAAPLARVIILTVSSDAYTVQEAIKRGAKGYLLKGATREEMRQAIRRVADGESHIDPSVSGHLIKLVRRSSKPEDQPLTPRELDVLRLAAAGLTNEAIAAKLGVTAETVKTHMSRAFARLGATDRANAVAICMRRGLF